ncbi:MAG: polyprenyl synthetase family protein [Clostridiales Family XIII bacterium]|jgi:geranylgeranyl diphosphate synthase type II|nr:polyprenyl synthetase family protein [Clostridiales Family XIII bacterium]
MIDLPEYRRLKYLIDEHLVGFLPDADSKSSTLAESMRYSINAGGKRIRPVLLLAACELAGGDTKVALPYAAAIEFIHTYSLIHDDLPAMDDDDLRRGEPTNHKVYGDAVAILAGDGLLSSAFEVMNFDLMLYFDNVDELKRRICAMYEIAKSAGVRGMIGGQVADIEAESKSVSAGVLDYIHLNKTAALIRAAVLAGAYIGGADSELIDSLRIYSENIGLAFQILDDILDVTGTEEEIGKDVGHDSKMSKVTYVSQHGMDASRARLDELTTTAIHAISPFGERNTEFFVDMARELAKRTV